LAMLGPQAAGPTEGWDAALHRQASPGERDQVARAGETLDRAFEDLELPRFHRAASGLSRPPPSMSTHAGRAVDTAEPAGTFACRMTASVAGVIVAGGRAPPRGRRGKAVPAGGGQPVAGGTGRV